MLLIRLRMPSYDARRQMRTFTSVINLYGVLQPEVTILTLIGYFMILIQCYDKTAGAVYMRKKYYLLKTRHTQ